MENGDNDVAKCSVPIMEGFHDEKKVLGTVDWVAQGEGIESLFFESRLSNSLCENFDIFEHTRWKRLVFMLLATESAIKLCDTVMMED